LLPTDEEKLEAKSVGATTFRCSKFVGNTSPIERCDAVYGDVPERYKAHFIKASEEEFKLNLELESEEETAIEKPKVKTEVKPKKKPAWQPN